MGESYKINANFLLFKKYSINFQKKVVKKILLNFNNEFRGFNLTDKFILTPILKLTFFFKNSLGEN